MGISQTVAPTEEPLTLAQAKAFLRVDADTEDDLITAMAVAAREIVERTVRRQLVTATWELTLDNWPANDEIVLPKPPLASVSSVTYYDTDEEIQTMDSDDYYVISNTEPGAVVLAYASNWPTAQARRDAIQVTYVAGYGDAGDVPDALVSAIKLILADLYEHREANIEANIKPNPAVSSLLWPYRVMEA